MAEKEKFDRSLEPVSYTHLDVYKRQENVIIGKLIPAGTGLPEVEEELVQAEIARDAAEAAYDH